LAGNHDGVLFDYDQVNLEAATKMATNLTRQR